MRHGDKRGRDLGYPTANLALDPGCGLRHGIYAVRVGVGGKLFDGVASFGTRPMFDNGAPLLEVHPVRFFRRSLWRDAGCRLHRLVLRDEMKLDSPGGAGGADGRRFGTAARAAPGPTRATLFRRLGDDLSAGRAAIYRPARPQTRLFRHWRAILRYDRCPP